MHRKKVKNETPIRQSLNKESLLIGKVQDGIGAVKNPHRQHLAEDIRSAFGDSLDIDAALHRGHEQENRWDYLLGHTTSRKLIALEPHSAREDEISTVIKKKEHACDQLLEHLKPGANISQWIWVASGTVHFADTEIARRRLDQHGIQFVGKRMLAKHLPALRGSG